VVSKVSDEDIKPNTFFHEKSYPEIEIDTIQKGSNSNYRKKFTPFQPQKSDT
jgi:hypothetical protein